MHPNYTVAGTGAVNDSIMQGESAPSYSLWHIEPPDYEPADQDGLQLE